jgi:hypothetical protein
MLVTVLLLGLHFLQGSPSLARNADPLLRVLSWQCVTVGRSIEVSGQVKNISHRTLKHVWALVQWRASDGSVIKREENYLTFTSIRPGETSPFVVTGIDHPSIRDCAISFQSPQHTIPFQAERRVLERDR